MRKHRARVSDGAYLRCAQPGRERGRPHRHRRAQRRRQVLAARRALGRARARCRPCSQDGLGHRRHAGTERPSGRRGHGHPRHRGGPPRIRVGGRCAHPRHPGRARGRPRPRSTRRQPVRRAAPPRRPRARADRQVGCAHDGRAHQPPRHRGHPLARRAPQAPLARWRGRAFGRDARPLVSRRGVPQHVGGARPHHHAVRGRLLRLYPAARRARASGGRRRGKTAEHPASRARVARARGKGTLEQAALQGRGGPRAHRGRTAAAQHDRAAPQRHVAPGQEGHQPQARVVRLGWQALHQAHRLEHRRGRPHRPARFQRCWQDDAAQPHPGQAQADRRKGRDRPDGQVRRALAAALRAHRASGPARARGVRPLQDALRAGRRHQPGPGAARSSGSRRHR